MEINNKTSKQTTPQKRSMHTNIIDKIPECWQGLFEALKSSQNNFQSAELWLQQKCYSQYEDPPQWEELISFLAQTKPESAIFQKPMFYFLPPDVQRKLLAVIFQNRHQICLTSLQLFLKDISECTEECSWQKTFCELLEGFVENSRKQDSSSELTTHYKFTEANRALSETICHKLLTNDSVWQTHNVTALGQEVSTDIKNYTSPDEEKELNISSAENSLSLNNNPKTEEMQNEKYVIIMDDEDTSDEPPPVKKAKEDLKTSSETEDENSLESTLVLKAEWLQEQLQSSGGLDMESSNLGFLSSLSPSQMKQLCTAADISTLPERCLSMASNLLKQMSTEISYSSCVAFISGCFLSKFSELEHTASRNLTNVLTDLAQYFPKQLIDSIANSCQISSMTSSQSDILCRLCKENFDLECQAHLLRQLLSNSPVTNEHGVLVLTCLVENIDKLEETTTSAVFDCLSNSTNSLCHSLKFGKLILRFVHRHGKTWSTAQISLMLQIMDFHKTFMKKSVISALKNISK